MGTRTAISTGALAVALAAIPMAAPSAAADDCAGGKGLLSGVTNGLCDLLDGVTGTVTGTVGQLTGGGDQKQPETKGAEDTVHETADDVLGTVGDAVPTTGPSKPAKTGKPQPTASALLPESLPEVCLPVLACGDQSVLKTLTPTPTPTATPATRGRPSRDAAAVPTASPARPPARPQLIDPVPRAMPTERTGERPATADPDEPRVELLWPNPFARELSVPMHDQRVRARPPASDVLGTALTIALLASAVLAARIVQQRRQREEPSESIPFEPARAGSGRHRLA
ncbi:hypothetical protein HII36_01085 [Nonomuraea sp. NN258]|uniref:hypothetical protein n=1 Tax=Nonomuraea antri TaxID=2730852 RepID=UPI001569F32A|nr:hypothetical protein [Nonomuraea antri]NRQ30438.1 hypothetical protein [Nonomuraea antri]